MFKLTTLLKRLSKQQSFCPGRLLGGEYGARTHASVVFVKNHIRMAEYLPVPDVNEYIVTPAVSGNGSATLATCTWLKT